MSGMFGVVGCFFLTFSLDGEFSVLWRWMVFELDEVNEEKENGILSCMNMDRLRDRDTKITIHKSITVFQTCESLAC